MLRLLAISCIVKVVLLASTTVISNDGPTYILEAQSIVEGNWQIADFGAYPFLIAILSFVMPDVVIAAQIISLSASVLTVVPLYLLMSRVWDTNVSFWGCLVFIFSPALNKFAVSVMRDPCFLLFTVFAIFFAWMSFVQQRQRYYLLASVFSVIAILFKLEGLVFPFVFFALCLFYGFVKKKSASNIALGAGVFAGTYVLLVILAFLFLDDILLCFPQSNYLFATVKYIFKEGIVNYDHAIKPALKELQHVLPGGNSNNNIADIVMSNVRLVYFLGLVSLFVKVLYFPYLCVLLLGVSSERRFGKNSLPLLCFLMGYLLMAFDHNLRRDFLEERYIYVPVVLALPWVGIGFVNILERLRQKNFPEPVILFLFVALFAFPVVDTFAYMQKRQTVALREAGEWLSRQDSLNGASLISNDRKIPFYAGRRSGFTNMSYSGMDSLTQRLLVDKFDLICIATASKDVERLPEFVGYELLKLFDDGNFQARIYKRQNLDASDALAKQKGLFLPRTPHG